MNDNKLIWHKYPNDKPDRECSCFVTIKRGKSRYVDISTFYIDDNEFYDFYDSQVIAWAYAEPYCDNDSIWNTYPEKKPSESNVYLVTYKGFLGNLVKLFWWFLEDSKFDRIDEKAISWAELPDPYKEEE